MARRERRRVQEREYIPLTALWQDYKRLSTKLPGHAFAHKGDVREAQWRGIYEEKILAIRNWYMAMELNDQNKLTQSAFPSAPHRNAKFSVSLKWEDKDTFAIFNFYGAFAAKKMLEYMIGEDEYTWLNQITIKTDRGIIIASDHIEDLIEYEYKGKEEQWEPPEPYPSRWRAFREGTSPPESVVANVPEPKPEKSSAMPHKSPVAAKSKQSRSSAPSTPRNRPGVVTIGELAAELGIKPPDARAALRSAKLTKPAGGWAWPQGELDAIRKILSTAKKKG
jgi:hypothetical protein